MSRRSPNREVSLKFRWQPKQWIVWQLILNSVATHIGFGGARGGSKSHFERQAALALGLTYPNIRILILRRTFKEVYANCIAPMFKHWGVTRDWYRGPSTEGWPVLKLPNGSEIVFGYAERKLDIYDFQGDEFAFIFVEEATHFNEEELVWLDTCNRWAGPQGFTPKTIWTCNPGNVGHDFVKRVMVDRAFNEREDPQDYAFVQAFGWDNVEWSRAALAADGLTQQAYYAWSDDQRFQYFITRSDYGRKLWAMSEQERAAHLYGDWDSFVGQFFREFSKRIHVVRPFSIPEYWERFASFDWGFKNPACQLWHAVSPDGLVTTYRELYVAGKDTPTLAKTCVDLTGDEKLRYRVGDPSCWDASRGPSIAEVMATNGWGMEQADNDRINGWARVRDFLAYEEDVKTGTMLHGPGWQTFETCHHLIRTLPSLIHDKHRAEDVDTDGEDHAADALRYGLMSRPRPTKIPFKALSQEWQEAMSRAKQRERAA